VKSVNELQDEEHCLTRQIPLFVAITNLYIPTALKLVLPVAQGKAQNKKHPKTMYEWLM
jgi:hypothetical protein